MTLLRKSLTLAGTFWSAERVGGVAWALTCLGLLIMGLAILNLWRNQTTLISDSRNLRGSVEELDKTVNKIKNIVAPEDDDD